MKIYVPQKCGLLLQQIYFGIKVIKFGTNTKNKYQITIKLSVTGERQNRNIMNLKVEAGNILKIILINQTSSIKKICFYVDKKRLVPYYIIINKVKKFSLELYTTTSHI